MGFTKLDSGIIFSSIMSEDDSVFKVWTVLLATCNADGISPVSTSFLEKITGKGEIEIERCIEVLSSPDKKSRSTNDEGRRIRRVDGGFFVINYEKYRESSASDYLRDKQRRYRDKKDVSIQKDTVSIPSASASSSELSINSINKDSIVLIVDFLNETCGTSYRASSEKTAKHINARLNEKFTVKDFKAVIRFKNEQWGEDEKMKEYLRPETLFGTKFESYLQAAPHYEIGGIVHDEEEESGPLLSIVDQIKADAERNKAGLNDK